MKRRSIKQKLVSEINITPFTDVILVLLVIFMITTPLISQTRLKINLPDAKSGVSPDSQQSQADIVITREGPIYLENKLVTKAELKEEIASLHRENAGLNVVVHSDKSVRFQKIVDVLDILSGLGITRLNIATTKEK